MSNQTKKVLLYIMTISLSSVTMFSQATNTKTTELNTKKAQRSVHPRDLNHHDNSLMSTGHNLQTTTTAATTTEETTTTTVNTTTAATTTAPPMPSSFSPIKPPLDDPTNAVLFTIKTLSSTDGLIQVQFSKEIITKFHDCLCKTDTNVCTVVTTATMAIGIKVEALDPYQTPQRSTTTFRCYAEINNSITCFRIAASDTPPCQDEDNCLPDFTTYGTDCAVGSVMVFWSDKQKLLVYVWNRQIRNIFACNGSCATSTTSNDDDDKMDTQSDPAMSPFVIGIIIAGAILVVGMSTFFCLCVLNVRRKSLSKSGHHVSGRVTSSDGLVIGQEGDFHTSNGYPVVGENGGFKGKLSSLPEKDTNANGYSSMSTTNSFSNNNSKGTSRDTHPRITHHDTQSHDESTYSHIDDTRVNNTGEYSSLDDATQYTRTYSALIPPIRDPRLLPPLPLPTKTSSETLPYYSLAKSFIDLHAPHIPDIASGHYIELIDEPNTAPVLTPNELGEFNMVSSTHPQNNSNITNHNSVGPNLNQNVYFELEKDEVHYASTSLEDVDYNSAGDDSHKGVHQNTS